MRLCATCFLSILITVATFSGCGGSSIQTHTDPLQTGKTDSPVFDRLLSIIDSVGMTGWANFGRKLQKQGRIRLVSTTDLDPEFNAFTWISDDCIWFSQIAFVRYPNEVDRAEILLHELVHLKTGEVTHGEVEQVCAQFRAAARAAGLYNNTKN